MQKFILLNKQYQKDETKNKLISLWLRNGYWSKHDRNPGDEDCSNVRRIFIDLNEKAAVKG